jgi:hypothetical protein
MPLHTIEAELASGALIEITSDHALPGGHVIDMGGYLQDRQPAGAGRPLVHIDRLKQALPERIPPSFITAGKRPAAGRPERGI